MKNSLSALRSARTTAAALVAATLLTGCNAVNNLYKRDTGTIAPVAAPDAGYVPVALPDQEDAGGYGEPALTDTTAAPEVLSDGEAIQPLDDAPLDSPPVADLPVEPEVVETYVVQKGDTLGHISQKLFGTIGRTKDLIDANPGINPKRMQIGDVINVPR